MVALEAVFTENFHFGRLVPAKVAQSAISEENRGLRVGWENALSLIFAKLLKIATFHGKSVNTSSYLRIAVTASFGRVRQDFENVVRLLRWKTPILRETHGISDEVEESVK